MKKLNLIALFSLILSLSMFAQNSNQKWAISFGAVATNHSTQTIGDASNGIFDQFFNHEYASFVAPLSSLKISRYVRKGIVADISAAAGSIDVRNIAFGKDANLVDNELFINAGVGLQFHPFAFIGKEESRIDPYARIGVTYNYFNYEGAGNTAGNNELVFLGPTLADLYNAEADKDGKTERNWANNNHVGPNFGAGLNLWITKGIGLALESNYNWILTPQITESFDSRGDFWQHTASLIFKLGKTDTDKDGILDKEDECPTVAGIVAFNGCPDTDSDGIKDSEDSCPTVAGPKENKGCPWGDADGDSVTDNLDKCPNEAGELANAGCPWGDADGDGVKDNLDKCPNEAGLVSNNGCPVKTVNFTEEAAKATKALQNLLFDSSKATIKPEGLVKLDVAAEIIKSNSGKYLISGHTDSSGSVATNNKLSAQRAAAVVVALEARGVEKGRLVSKGFGSSKPVADNASAEGKQANRRVEVSVLSN